MAYIGRDIQYGTFSKQSLTPDGSTVTFTLDQGVADATNLLLSNGGVIQEPNVAYTASGTTLTMSAAPAATDVIWITYLGKELTVVDLSAKSDLAFQVGTGDGSNVNPIATLDRVTPSAESIMVMTDGVTQVPGTDYTVNGTTLTFTTAPANGVKILVYFLGIAQGIGTPSDGTVTDAKIVDMSSSKLTGALPAIDGSALTNMPAELPATGSSGNVLTSDGANWTSAAAAGGGLASIQVFTTTGTWTKPSGITKVWVRVQGGGGGGGGATDRLGGGGGGGGYCEEFIDVSGTSSETITIGIGGSGGVGGGWGSSGGTSSFGSFNSATGGSVGQSNGTGPDGGLGGAGSGGAINMVGSDGIGNSRYNASGHEGYGGQGGSSVLGGGGRAGNGSNGSDGNDYGGGGGGAMNIGTTISRTGGSGAGGCIIVLEFK